MAILKGSTVVECYLVQILAAKRVSSNTVFIILAIKIEIVDSLNNQSVQNLYMDVFNVELDL